MKSIPGTLSAHNGIKRIRIRPAVFLSALVGSLSLALASALFAIAAEGKPPIEPATGGTFTLETDLADLSGKSVQRIEASGALENWASFHDQASWKVKNAKMGVYDATVTWSVADQDAHQGYKVDVDHRSTIRAFTVGTGGADKFKRETVGRIMLAPGVHDVTFFPTDGAVRGGLCKLKRIELVPVDDLASQTPHEPVELHAPPGFDVQLVAGPPLTRHPMLAFFDDRGRLYVAESTGVNADGSVLEQSPPHQILMLEDVDGDGTFDKKTLFADKLTFPQGVLWHEGSIYASSPPNFWRLTDDDGDGVVDRREVLATGFPFRGMSDDMHGASLGRDGRIYFAAGRFPHKIRRPGEAPIHRGRNPLIVRCRPDGSELEVFCGAMGNAVGVAFSDEGDCFASGTFGVNASGKRDVLNHCIEGGAYPVLGQTVDEHKMTGGEMPNLAQFGASASSDLTIYQSEAFGEEFRGNLFSAMFNMRKIARHVLEPDGATYRCRSEDFLTSPNPDFHPTDVLEDADGSFLVIDTGAWFLIGCPTSVIAKPQLSGGIYRVRRTDRTPVADPRGLKIAWDDLKNDKLVALLDDARFAVRDRAMATLAARGKSSLPAIRAAMNEKSTARLQLNAVWTVSRIAGPDAAAVVRTALTDGDEGVRQAAATASGLFRDGEATPTLMEMVGSDESPAVRRDAAGAIGRIGAKDAAPALLAALVGVRDRFLDHAILLALIRLDNREQTVAGLDDPSPEVRRGALIALDQMDHGQLTQDDVTRALAHDDVRLQQSALEIVARRPGWSKQMVELAKRWLADAELSTEGQAALRGVLSAYAGDESIQRLVADRLSDPATPSWTRPLLLDVIGRNELKTFPSLWRRPLLDSLAAENDDQARAAIVALVAANQTLGDDEPLAQAELLALSRNKKRPLDLRVAAASAAFRPDQSIPGDVFELFGAACRAEVNPIVRMAASSAIGMARLDEAQRRRVIALVAAAGPLEAPALLRPFETIAAGPLATELIHSLERSAGLSAIPADRLAKLIESLPDDVRSQAGKLLQGTSTDLESQRRRLEELNDALVDGDAERGRKLFFGAKASCSACHRVGEEGGNIGPNLAGIGDIRTRRDLLEAVAFPSASFARNFEPYRVTTDSGITYSGVINRTTSDALYLVTTERKIVRIARDEIDDDGVAPAQVSIMPQGLDRILLPGELKDLLAYLSSLRGQK